MTLRATPILEGSQAEAFELNDGSLSSRQFVDLLDAHKALLFQTVDGSGPFSTEDFGDFVVKLRLESYPYVGGAAPRTIIPVKAGQDIVFTANESPPDQPIPFHNELAQTASPPNYVFFYCHTPALQGGETPIIDSTLVYRYVKENHGDFLAHLVEHRARYTRTLPAQDDPSSPIGRSYQNTYHVKSRDELDAKLADTPGCDWTWNDDGSVRVTTAPVPAIRLVKDHCQNLVCQYTFSNSIVAAFLGWQDSRNDRHEALHFGNNTKMPEPVLQDIADFMQQHRVCYQWQQGDILALNNQLVMHSRNPFEGKRVVYASLWGPPQTDAICVDPPRNVSLGSRPPSFYKPLVQDPLVFGFWKVSKDACADVCYEAIKAGYRRLDCACDYGNEEEVGQGIQKALQEGICSRRDLCVTAKLWNTYHDPNHVPLALEKSLMDLKLDYVDEFLIHFPISLEFVPFDERYPPEWTNSKGEMNFVANDMNTTWRAMEALVDAGKCRTIGVCNFSTQLLRQVLSICRIRPSTLQVELHPHNAQSKLVRFAHDAGMKVTGFSVLGASSYVEVGMATDGDVLFQNKGIQELAACKQKTAAQILLRWALQRNTFPLCKTSTPARMQENRDVFDFHLTPSEMQQINRLDQGRRYNDPGVFCEPGMGSFCPIYE